jgi:hypothetical protein
MVFIERGKVQNGAIVFSEPLNLPEGTDVVVQIEPVAADREAPQAAADDDFAALPFFGMWTGREDMSESVAWVRREREQWHQRVERQD